MKNFVAISGSLRQHSTNTTLLRAAMVLAPSGMHITLYDGVGSLPHFNPDIEDAPPPVVEAWRALLRDCDGVLIASPEYAHGVAGALKNALDWVVGSAVLVGKPVALFNSSGRAVHAQAALAETIVTMGWRVVDEASPVIPVAGKNHSLAAMLEEPAVVLSLRNALGALLAAAE